MRDGRRNRFGFHCYAGIGLLLSVLSRWTCLCRWTERRRFFSTEVRLAWDDEVQSAPTLVWEFDRRSFFPFTAPAMPAEAVLNFPAQETNTGQTVLSLPSLLPREHQMTMLAPTVKRREKPEITPANRNPPAIARSFQSGMRFGRGFCVPTKTRGAGAGAETQAGAGSAATTGALVAMSWLAPAQTRLRRGAKSPVVGPLPELGSIVSSREPALRQRL